MSLDLTNPVDQETFREQALSRGVPIDEVENYIKSKTTSGFSLPKLTINETGNVSGFGLPEIGEKQTEKSVLPTKQELPQTPVSPISTPSANIAPVQPSGSVRITQPFGNPNAALYGRNSRGQANINRGLDIAGKPGEIQSAPPEGKWVVASVDTSGWNTGWGNTVVIKNVNTGETIRRSHLDKVYAKPGQEITGKAIGTTGRTGRTTGYHKDVEYTTSQGKLSDYSKSPYFKYER